jgi:hypothetical protein
LDRFPWERRSRRSTGTASEWRSGFKTRTTATGGGSCWPPAPTGIRVGEPGFEHVRIEPKPTGDLKWAGGRVETVRGLVESSWKLTETPGEGHSGHGIALDLTVPGNATPTVEIPRLGADNVRVRESGTNVWNEGNQTNQNQPGIESIERTDGAVAVEIGAGRLDGRRGGGVGQPAGAHKPT